MLRTAHNAVAEGWCRAGSDYGLGAHPCLRDGDGWTRSCWHGMNIWPPRTCPCSIIHPAVESIWRRRLRPMMFGYQIERCSLATRTPLCLLKSRNRRASVAFLVPCPYRRGHERTSVGCRFPALVPATQPRFAGARACRSATPGDRPASATPWPASALLDRQVALGLALPNLAAGPQHHGAGQTGNRCPMAS
jgi:hypothetical protein